MEDIASFLMTPATLVSLVVALMVFFTIMTLMKGMVVDESWKSA